MPWEVALALRRDGWFLRCDIVWAKDNPLPESVRDRPTRSHEYLFLLARSERYYYDADAVREAATYGVSASPGMYDRRIGANQHRDNRVRDARIGGEAGAVEKGDGSTGRNLRSVWAIPTHAYADAHFATYPPRLVEPCVKAGTSERGCCGGCGAPYRRMVEREYLSAAQYQREPGDVLGKCTTGDVTRFGDGVNVRTTGWAATCTCGHPDTVPATVLDCFGGSGTTAAVATRLGRRAILIDQSEEYLKLAAKRLGAEPTRLFALPGEFVPRKKPPKRKPPPEPEPARYVCPQTLTLPEVD